MTTRKHRIAAHVLINVAVGKAKSVYKRLLEIENIIHVDGIAGPYDIIATIEGDDLSTVARIVLEEIQHVDGVTNTLTCTVVDLEE